MTDVDAARSVAGLGAARCRHDPVGSGRGRVAARRDAWRAARSRRTRARASPICRFPGHPEVFVVGDAASFTQEGHLLPGVAQVAIQQARARGRGPSSAGNAASRQRRSSTATSGNLAIIGRGSAIADIGRLHFSGPLAWLFWLFLHIFKLIGFRNRLSRDAAVGVGVRHVPAQRTTHHATLKRRRFCSSLSRMAKAPAALPHESARAAGLRYVSDRRPGIRRTMIVAGVQVPTGLTVA